MKRFSAQLLAAVLITLVLAVPGSAGTVITGELVVTNGSTRQFRIVDHGGFFNAPSGMNIEALDGKPVVVELSDNRQVLSITEKPIHIDRVESHYETINGELVLVDAARGTFAIAGAPQTYVAPRNIDVRRFAGQNVELFLDGQGQVLQIEFDRPAQIVAGGCSYQGRSYGTGMSLCQTGTQYRCENGVWRSQGIACRAAGDAPAAIFPTARSCVYSGTSYSNGAARCLNGVRFVCADGQWQYVNRGCGPDVSAATSSASCEIGGATLADGSSICRDGVTFRCSAGSWVNVGTACR
jgi:hypothetical protein